MFSLSKLSRVLVRRKFSGGNFAKGGVRKQPVPDAGEEGAGPCGRGPWPGAFPNPPVRYPPKSLGVFCYESWDLSVFEYEHHRNVSKKSHTDA